MAIKISSFFSNSKILLIIFSFSIAGGSSFAADYCGKLFEPEPKLTFFAQIKKNVMDFIPGYKTPYTFLNDNEKQVWRDLVSTRAKYKKVNFVLLNRDSSDPMLWMIWRKLPQQAQSAIIRLLSYAQGNQSEIRKFTSRSLKEISENPSDSNLFFEVILSRWLNDRINHEINFKDWLTQELDQFEQKLVEDGDLFDQLSSKLNWAQLATEASQSWSERAGVHRLNIVSRGRHSEVEILNSFYPVRLNTSQKSLKIRVPRNLIRVAAWNPIYHEVLVKKATEGFEQLAKYPGFLAADGYFYLSDGNHRFTLDQREFVWIEMSYPAQTSSMRITFDAIGLPQPSLENLILYYTRQINLNDLIPNQFEEFKFN